MQLTKAPLRLPPHKCVVTGREDGEMIDFEAEPMCSEPPHIYVMKTVVEEAAVKLCGMSSKADVDAVLARLEEMRAEVAELNDTLNMAAEFEQLAARLLPDTDSEEVPV